MSAPREPDGFTVEEGAEVIRLVLSQAWWPFGWTLEHLHPGGWLLAMFVGHRRHEPEVAQRIAVELARRLSEELGLPSERAPTVEMQALFVMRGSCGSR